MSLTDILK